MTKKQKPESIDKFVGKIPSFILDKMGKIKHIKYERVPDRKILQPGEIISRVRYKDKLFRFGYEDKQQIWSVFEHNYKSLDFGVIQSVMDSPSLVSVEKPRSYKRLISTGKVFDIESGNSITVRYFMGAGSLKRPGDLREAFWYNFRPLFDFVDGRDK
jgi:hypothetical protein